MPMKCQHFSQMVGLPIMLLSLAGCGNKIMTGQRVWSESTAAPNSMEFWAGSGQTIKFPVHKDQFIKAVSSLGGRFYITGTGEARSLSAPPPRLGSPCSITPTAIVVNFVSDRQKETPTYVAYLDQADVIQCVDKQFAYSG